MDKVILLGTEKDEFYQLVLVLQCFQYVVLHILPLNPQDTDGHFPGLLGPKDALDGEPSNVTSTSSRLETLVFCGFDHVFHPHIPKK